MNEQIINEILICSKRRKMKSVLNFKTLKVILLVTIYFFSIFFTSYKFQQDTNIMLNLLILLVLLFIIFSKMNLKKLIVFLLIFNILVGALTDITGIKYLSYFNDLIILIFIFIILAEKEYSFSKLPKVKWILGIIIIGFLFNILGAISSESKILSASFQIYQYNKYYFIFIIVYLMDWDIKDWSKIEKILEVLIIIQTIIVLLQYYNGKSADFISGTFGAGGTGILMLYQLFYISLISAKFKSGKMSFIKYLLLIIVVCIPSIVAEIKMTWLMLIITIGVVFLKGKKDLKTIFSISLAVIISLMGLKYMLSIYPQFNYMFESKKNFMWYIKDMHYGENSLNRLSAIPYFNENVLTSKVDKLFGIGIGNGLASSISILSGRFYQRNYYLKYQYFFLPYLYLENGIIGSVMYIAILLIVLYRIIKYRVNNISLEILNNSAITFIIINLVCMLYNQALYLSKFAIFFWSVLGITVSLNEKLKNESRNF